MRRRAVTLVLLTLARWAGAVRRGDAAAAARFFSVKVGFVFGDPAHPRRFTEWWQVTDGADPRPSGRPVVDAASAATFAAAAATP